MSTRKKPIPDLIADSLTKKLTDEEIVALENWKKAAIENQELADSFSDINERVRKLHQYNSADGTAIWNDLRLKAYYDRGLDIGPKPEPIVFLSKTLRRILITMLVLAAISITGIFYMTISNLKNRKYPVKPILWHNFRLR